MKSYDAFPASHLDIDDQSFSGVPNGIPDILDEVKYATDYLQKLLVDTGSGGWQLIERIAGAQDHENFYTSPTESEQTVANGGGERPVYDGAMSDIAGICAAALALMSIHYRQYNSTYADACVDMGQRIYDYASDINAPTSSDPYYPSTTYVDDQFCGAMELWRATSNTTYYNIAVAKEASIGPTGWVVDWDNHVDYCRHSAVVAGFSGTAGRWQVDVNSYLTHISTNVYTEGLAYFSDWGSLRYAAGAGFSAALYYSAVAGASVEYKNFALSQIEYIMGNNTYDRSFVIGFGKNPPQNPQHRNSYGRENWPDPSLSHLYEIYGGMVGGPTQNNNSGVNTQGYYDITTDYVGNEVALDYNTGIVGLSSWVISWITSGATTTTAASASGTHTTTHATSTSTSHTTSTSTSGTHTTSTTPTLSSTSTAKTMPTSTTTTSAKTTTSSTAAGRTTTTTTTARAPATTTTGSASGCLANTTITTSWSTGFSANIYIICATGGLEGWQVNVYFPASVSITSFWTSTELGATSGTMIPFGNLSYNGVVTPAGSSNFGFNAGFSGTLDTTQVYAVLVGGSTAAPSSSSQSSSSQSSASTSSTASKTPQSTTTATKPTASAGQTQGYNPIPSPTSSSQNDSGGGISGGAIAGIIIGLVIVAGAVTVGFLFYKGVISFHRAPPTTGSTVALGEV